MVRLAQNWVITTTMQVLVIFGILLAVIPDSEANSVNYGVKKCPRGWLQYDETCYFRQPDLMGFDEAKASCERRNAQMFGIDDSFEVDAVRKLFPDYYFTWVQADVEEELEWLYEPYEEVINGKSTVSKCIGFYSSPTSKSYTYWYPCASRFHSICEKPLASFRQWVQ